MRRPARYTGTSQRERRMRARDGADEARCARTAATTSDRADQRHGAALPRGARRAEKGKRHDQECERIERHRDSVVQLGAELPGRPLVRRIVGLRVEQFRESIAHGWRTSPAPAPGDKPRQVEGVVLEPDDDRIAACRPHAGERRRSPAAGRCRARWSADRPARRRSLPRSFGSRWSSTMMPEQLAVRLALADVQRQLAVDDDEAAGLHVAGDDFGAHLRSPSGAAPAGTSGER